MAITKKRTTTTVVEEYDASGGTTAPDTAFPMPEINNGSTNKNSPSTGDFNPNELSSDQGSISFEHPRAISKSTVDWHKRWQTIGAVFTITLSVIGGIWYLSKLDSRVEYVKEFTDKNSEKIDQAEKNIDTLKANTETLKENLDNLEKTVIDSLSSKKKNDKWKNN